MVFCDTFGFMSENNATQKRPIISSSDNSKSIMKSSVGRKVMMAITGASFFLFLIAHLAGNLLVFAGADALNEYAVALRQFPVLLWISRIFMISFFLMHIGIGIKLYLENKTARPMGYVKNVNLISSSASRTMILSGLVLLSFVVYHLLHFTFVITNPEFADLVDSAGRFDAYSMIILGFQNYYVSAIYIIAIIFLSLHVSHGFFSLFQTLGLTKESLLKKIQMIGNLFAAILMIGFLSIPIAVLAGILTLPSGGGN